MSTINGRDITRNQATFDRDLSKVFIRNNRYTQGNIEASGADLTLVIGTLIGRITESGKLAVSKSGSSDGSEFPIGVCAEALTITDGNNADINICVSGDVVKSAIVFDGSDDFTTDVDGKIYEDRIGSDTVGIKLTPSTDQDGFDN